MSNPHQIITTRERLYGGPLQRGKRFHYVARLGGVQVTTGETKERTLANAADTLLGALDKQTSTIYATPAHDGTIIVTREYAPGLVEQGFHRAPSYQSSGISMSKLEIGGARVSVHRYHEYCLTRYNEVCEVSA